MVQFDRNRMEYFPLDTRYSKVEIEKAFVDPRNCEISLSSEEEEFISQLSSQLRRAKAEGAARMCVFGAHTIKNGLGRLLGAFAEKGWFTHLATNGAGVIHDWEFAFHGRSSEDVRANVSEGKFGTWQETGLYINLAIALGAYHGLGYGESVGKLIQDDGLMLPSREELEHTIADSSAPLSKRGAACDLLQEQERLGLGSGLLEVKHLHKSFSVQAKCYELGIPFTSHPMFGHDIIYTHKACCGSAIGRTAEVDFLRFVDSVSHLEGGVYLSVGSAVMSPMIFEKSLSMARNVALQEGKDIRNVDIHVVDLQEKTWDWEKGEPPMDNPAYYLRYMKTFSRMGCRVDYHSMDNRALLVALYRELEGTI